MCPMNRLLMLAIHRLLNLEQFWNMSEGKKIFFFYIKSISIGLFRHQIGNGLILNRRLTGPIDS